MIMRTTALAALALALAVPITAQPVAAAPPEPERPAYVPPDDEDGLRWEEGFSVDDIEYHDEGSTLRVLDHRWLVLNYYNGDFVVYRWYGTRGGSTFYLNYCDQDGDMYLARVPRKVFLTRVAATPEASVDITYDRRRDSGVFRVGTLYESLPCEVRER